MALHLNMVEQLFIEPAQQCRGIGKQLPDVAKAELPAGFYLTTVQQSRAGRFYERESLQPGEISIHPRLGHQIIRYDWHL